MRTYTGTHTHTHTHNHRDIDLDVNVDIFIYIYIYSLHVFIHIFIDRQPHKHTSYIQTDTRTDIHIHTYRHSNIHTYIGHVAALTFRNVTLPTSLHESLSRSTTYMHACICLDNLVTGQGLAPPGSFHLAALAAARMKLAEVAPDEVTYLALVQAFKAGGLSRSLAQVDPAVKSR